MTDNLKGSIWIAVNATGKAACPHCEKLSWNSGTNKPWGSGCAHAIAPGTMKDNHGVTLETIIFKGQK